LFSVRAQGSESAVHDYWPTRNMPGMRAHAVRLFDQLSSVARALVDHILACSQSQSVRFEQPFEIFDGKSISQSNMTLFQYGEHGRVTDSVHTPYHTDVGLLTIIPKSRGASGLHVFDWVDGWMDIENGMPPNCAVVMVGETLTAITNHFISASVHEVAHVDGVRWSCPLQLLAQADCLINASSSAAGFGFSSADWSSIPASHFVSLVSSTRVSSNFPRKK
jgi:isopenicillin N synthase-like dioxygenase